MNDLLNFDGSELPGKMPIADEVQAVPVAIPEDIANTLPSGATDPVQLFAEVLELFDNAEKWKNQPLSKIKIISNTKVGSVGQFFIEKMCNDLNIPIEFPMNVKGVRATKSPWDVRIDGIEYELKTATEDTGGNFQFNHIRYHRPYEALICLGVSPNNLYFGLWAKADVTTGKAGRLVSMEKNANASFKLTKRKAQLLPIADFGTQLKAFTDKFKSNS